MTDQIKIARNYWKCAILQGLEDEFLDENNEAVWLTSISLRVLAERLQENVSFVVSVARLEAVLAEMDLTPLRVVSTPFAPSYIMADGLQIEGANQPEQLDSLLNVISKKNDVDEVWKTIANLGVDWLYECLRNIGFDDREADESESEPIRTESDEAWEPLPLEYDTPESQDVIAALEETVEAIEKDNGYNAEFPAERNSVLKSLRSNIEYMKAYGEYTKVYFKHGVISPLYRVSKRFGEHAIGLLARASLKAIEKWITDKIFKGLDGL